MYELWVIGEGLVRGVGFSLRVLENWGRSGTWILLSNLRCVLDE